MNAIFASKFLQLSVMTSDQGLSEKLIYGPVDPENPANPVRFFENLSERID